MQDDEKFDCASARQSLCGVAYNLLDDLEKDDKTYILVAHNGIARVVKSYFYEMTNEEYADFGVKNCEILRFDYK